MNIFTRLFNKDPEEKERKSILRSWKREREFHDFAGKVLNPRYYGASENNQFVRFHRKDKSPKIFRDKNKTVTGSILIQYFKRANLSEMTALNHIYKNLFTDREHWLSLDEDVRYMVRKKAIELILIYDRRTRSATGSLAGPFMELDELLSKVLREDLPQVDLGKNNGLSHPALNALLDRIQNILAKNSVYKHRCRTMMVLIEDADHVRGENLKNLIAQLTAKVQEHEQQFLHAPQGQIDDIRTQVITERLATV